MLIFDDDMIVVFGKVYEYVKLIVVENVFVIILGLLEICKDVEVVSEFCVILSRLVVRNEYCKDIVD